MKPIRDVVFDGSVRITPTIDPQISAMIQAQIAVSTVNSRPDNSMSR